MEEVESFQRTDNLFRLLLKLSLMIDKDVVIISTKGWVLNVDIYYEIKGTGFPVVLLHGNGENHHIFEETAEVLSKEYQVIMIDSRYHGLSIHEGELSYHQMSIDVSDVIDELKINSYDVIGFSDGGIIALLLALMDKRIKHMVIIGANTQPQMIKSIYRLSMYLTLFCLLPFCTYNKKARLKWKLQRLMLKEPHIQYDDLKNIKIPVLVMAGEYDMIKEKDTLAIGKSLPYGTVKIMKQGNHFILRDMFKQTIREIDLFLRVCHEEERL